MNADQPPVPAPTPNVSETPRTDAQKYRISRKGLPTNALGCTKSEIVPADFARQLERELAAVTKERDTLHDWKESALSILNEINFQEIGKALGLGLGLSVPKNILPGIRALQEKLAMAMIERDAARERAEQVVDETGNEIHALKGQLIAMSKARDGLWIERCMVKGVVDAAGIEENTLFNSVNRLREQFTAALARAEKAEEDTRRLDWLERKHVSCKWEDGLPFVRPRHPKHCYAIPKYIGEDGWTIRAAIDAALTPTKEPAP